jgi:hypothetical protein
MTIPQAKQLINLMRHKGIVFEPGLSDAEVIAIEAKFDIQFPPDLKRFFQLGLPVNDLFYNWRKGLTDDAIVATIQKRMNWPLEDVFISARNNGLWRPEWGNKPTDAEERVVIAQHHCLTYPKLIPICGHRYISSEPHENGNPVFSMHGMDIVYYGFDLATYFSNEFFFKLNSSFELPTQPREIVFWTSLVS